MKNKSKIILFFLCVILISNTKTFSQNDCICDIFKISNSEYCSDAGINLMSYSCDSEIVLKKGTVYTFLLSENANNVSIHLKYEQKFIASNLNNDLCYNGFTFICRKSGKYLLQFNNLNLDEDICVGLFYVSSIEALKDKTLMSFETITYNDTTTHYKVGDYRPELGGYIFYVDPIGKHGLVCADKNQGGLGCAWGCHETAIRSGATATGLYQGKQNTLNIVSECKSTDIAARLCYDLELNGYDDWYLPSRDELRLMYSNLYLNGIGTFSDFRYWSSSEYLNTGAMTIDFTD